MFNVFRVLSCVRLCNNHRIITANILNRNVFYATTAMDLNLVVSILESFAPRSLSENWDNVGLLVEPSGSHQVGRVMLTNDLTEDVLAEGIAKKADLIVSYHPPIFASLKRVTGATWKERLVVGCLENRVALYSPHTAWDAVSGGVNDWLAAALDCLDVQPIIPATRCARRSHTCAMSLSLPKNVLEISENQHAFDACLSFLTNEAEIHVCVNENSCGWHVTAMCSEQSLARITSILSPTPDILDRLQVVKLKKIPVPHYGMGRICTLKEPISVDELVQRIKSHLKLPSVRLALGTKRNSNGCDVRCVALCAGSGATVLGNVPADVYWTGEMSHHEVLDAISKGTSVVLCEHSNTERGFLWDFAPKLEGMLGDGVQVFVSKVDKDPVIVV